MHDIDELQAEIGELFAGLVEADCVMEAHLDLPEPWNNWGICTAATRSMTGPLMRYPSQPDRSLLQ